VDPGRSRVFVKSIYTTYNLAADHHCDVTLYNSQGGILDATKTAFHSSNTCYCLGTCECACDATTRFEECITEEGVLPDINRTSGGGLDLNLDLDGKGSNFLKGFFDSLGLSFGEGLASLSSLIVMVIVACIACKTKCCWVCSHSSSSSKCCFSAGGHSGNTTQRARNNNNHSRDDGNDNTTKDKHQQQQHMRRTTAHIDATYAVPEPVDENTASGPPPPVPFPRTSNSASTPPRAPPPTMKPPTYADGSDNQKCPRYTSTRVDLQCQDPKHSTKFCHEVDATRREQNKRDYEYIVDIDLPVDCATHTSNTDS